MECAGSLASGGGREGRGRRSCPERPRRRCGRVPTEAGAPCQGEAPPVALSGAGPSLGSGVFGGVNRLWIAYIGTLPPQNVAMPIRTGCAPADDRAAQRMQRQRATRRGLAHRYAPTRQRADTARGECAILEQSHGIKPDAGPAITARDGRLGKNIVPRRQNAFQHSGEDFLRRMVDRPRRAIRSQSRDLGRWRLCWPVRNGDRAALRAAQTASALTSG